MDAMPLVVILFVVLGIASLIFHFSRAKTMLERWAARNGLRLLEREARILARGPFFLSTATGQEVFRILVQDQQGQVRRGYVRCGGFLFGMLSDRVDVRWDADPPRQPGFPVVFPDAPDRRD